MTPNNNLSVLPWYTSLEQQNARKWWVYGRVYPLFTPAGRTLPFQILIPHVANSSITSIQFYDANTNTPIGGNALSDFTQGGLQIKQFADYDVVVFPSDGPNFGPTLNGRYYLQAVINSVTYYSEIYTVVNDIQPYLKIRWWDLADFVMDAGTIVYTEPIFKNILYLKADIAKPEYNFEDEGENRDGYFFPTKQISEKKYRFNFLASEYLLDVMRFIRMADYVEIEYHGQTYKPDTFLITPEWENEGDVAVVEAEFDTDTVAKKLPYMELTPPVPTNYLSVNPTSIVFAATGETLTLNISSNVAWTISVPNWITASALSGQNNGTVTLTAAQNNTGSTRSGYITVVGNGAPSVNVSAMQPIPASKYLSVSPSSVTFLPEGASVSLTIASNVAWTLTVPNWVTASALSGNGNGTVTLTAGANTGGTSRSGNVVFSGTDVPGVTVSLSQAAQIVPAISISRPTFDSDYKERTFYFRITCNGAWECSGSTAAWLTCDSTGNGNGTATIHLDKNTTASSRTGTLTFRMIDYPNVTCTSVLTQSAYNPTMTYDLVIRQGDEIFTFSADGSEVFTPVVYGITYEDGVEVSRQSLNGNDITFSVTGDVVAGQTGMTFRAQDLGTTLTPRQHQIWTLAWNAHPSETGEINIYQEANTRTLIEDSTSIVPAEESTIIWDVSGTSLAATNGDYTQFSPRIDITHVIRYQYTSGAISRDETTERDFDTAILTVATGVGLTANDYGTTGMQRTYDIDWLANTSGTPRDGRLILRYDNTHSWLYDVQQNWR